MRATPGLKPIVVVLVSSKLSFNTTFSIPELLWHPPALCHHSTEVLYQQKKTFYRDFVFNLQVPAKLRIVVVGRISEVWSDVLCDFL